MGVTLLRSFSIVPASSRQQEGVISEVGVRELAHSCVIFMPVVLSGTQHAMEQTAVLSHSGFMSVAFGAPHLINI